LIVIHEVLEADEIADRVTSVTYLLYDAACGTGGMLTVAEETLQELAAEYGKEVATHLYGQEINAETFAICKADLLLKGDGEAADNIVYLRCQVWTEFCIEASIQHNGRMNWPPAIQKELWR